MLKINEVFFSIQGESSYAGWPTVFIRTSGCNLRCTYCDTTYAYYDGSKKSVDELLAVVASYSAKHVCITGGEPLLQPEVHSLMDELCKQNYKVSVETSGSVSCKNVNPLVKKVVDVKTPDSGAADSFLMENLSYSSDLDEYKFVICSEKDFFWAEDFVKKHLKDREILILYSPSFNKVSEKMLAEWILSHKSIARFQMQLHKYIWLPNTRGV